MFLISVDAEYKYRIKRELKANNFSDIEIFTEDDINDNNAYDKYKFIITDYNTEVIDYFLNIGNKKIIVINRNEELFLSKYSNRENIYMVNDVSEAISTIKENKKYISKKIPIGKILMVPTAVILIIALLFAINNTDILKDKTTKKITETKEKAPKTKENKDSVKKEKEKIDYGKENYLFLGDSITDFYDLEKFYGDLPVVNSGISGNQYKDLINNLEDRVYKYNPTKVFLLIGTNDMAFTDVTNEDLVDHIIEICDEIQKNREKTKIYVESIYPVNRRTDNDVVDLGMVLGRYNDRIQEINKLLKEKVEENNYTYIDMYSKLEDEDGNLKVDYTIDGLHMSDEGYEVITSEIKKIIESE